MIRTLLIAASLLFAACAAPPAGEPQQSADQTPFVGIDGRPLVSPQGVTDNSVQQALTANAAACTKAGGTLQPVCMMGRPMCIVTFKDAGKTCSDGSECNSGRCRTTSVTAKTGPATGACSANNGPCGCFQLVVKGESQPALCVD